MSCRRGASGFEFAISSVLEGGRFAFIRERFPALREQNGLSQGDVH